MTGTSHIARSLRPRQSDTAPRGASQGAVVEQARAVADVQAAAQMARMFPRDTSVAVEAMEESCRQVELADRAFFSYPRAGQTVVGGSVHLARELARCWGHMDYGVKELSRGESESEMLAFAWDLQTNARAETTFIVPHVRSRSRGGAVELTDVRDIYENNANMGARRLREMIFSVLPAWFVEQAKALCQRTLEEGDGSASLGQRVASAVAAFDELGVSRRRLEARVGRPTSEWTAGDVARIGVVYGSLQRGESRVEDEFESESVTAAQLTGEPEPEAPGLEAR